MNSFRLLSVAAVCVLAVFFFVLEKEYERHLVEENRQEAMNDAQRRADSLKSKINLRIARDIHILYGLRALVEIDPNITQEQFSKFAASVRETSPGIVNIAAAPDLVVKYVFPYEPNKKVLGLDYRQQAPEQRRAVFRSVRQSRPVIAGPTELVQGGVAIILRLPVFTRTVTGERKLWGILAAPVSMDQIFKDVEFSFYESEYEIAIRGKDGLGRNGAIFYGKEELFGATQEALITSVPLLNGSWVLAMKPKGGWPGGKGPDTAIIGYFFAAFVMTSILFVLVSAYFRERSLARKKIEVSLKEKSEFLEILTHEIRSPLQGVLAVQKYLLDNEINPKFRELVSTARETGDYIVSLINDYLDLQRAESNNLQVIKQPTDVRLLLSRVLDIVGVMHNNSNVSLITNVSDDVPDLVLVDERKLKQVLVNLVTNALKFTDLGVVRIKITHNLSDTDPTLGISVEDTGIGISSDALNSLFDRFTRTEHSEHRVGSGLGLTIVKTLIDVMDGEVEVTSQVGEGSMFRIELPAEIVSQLDLEKMQEAEVPAKSTYKNLRSLSVLIADDMLVNRTLLEALLKPSVGSVSVAEDGSEALDLLNKEKFDLVIMDARMPVMNGIDAVKRIRNDSRLSGLPVIGLTGVDSNTSHASMLDAGMDRVLTKPVNIDVLLKEIDIVLGERGSMDHSGD
ncbi:response regulator [Sneathiella sp. P13V-1]|uniref:ATP-binding protein n=1 Tax=Sneathiella sp. P13V-1 TaxID=2697366 RepID=UPI00187B17DC|nr:ATP-binding protein [Sneathiella sp. P13V-1]MBE7636370.1 response regulator [Sneathiella sp. P13V-1]